MTTMLAQQWESQPELRRLAQKLQLVQLTGPNINRDVLVQNELVLTPALQQLGMRPSVQTAMVHVKSLYDLMGLDVNGALIYTQGWALRRMVSLFNGIVRRGHTPREPAVQRMMVAVGLTIEQHGSEGTSDNDSMSDECESMESEAPTDDGEVVDGDDDVHDVEMSR
ncbi:unnamed protein product [Symbiodinium pilosum]|uniref:Uncharacterized protein n=1 Tax=Symbiodinium pilosum TaxID=2952 RepID=A0A812TQB3_SYMPI|nr:unnamed protein product [Symbiodinium pilosum]